MPQPPKLFTDVLCANSLSGWLGAVDEFRNWLTLGLQPAKAHENRVQARMASAGAARSNRASGAIEAEQLFDPERA
jgi:hypothetical protein